MYFYKKIDLIFLFLFLGCFYNFIIIKILYKKNLLLNKRSLCYNCHEQFSLYSILPVFVYIIFKKKDGICDKGLIISKAVSEILSIIVYLSIYYAPSGIQNKHILYLMGTYLIIASIIDVNIQVIPNALTFIFFIVTIILKIYLNKTSEFLIDSILILLFLYIIYEISNGGIGGGDVKGYFYISYVINKNNSIKSIILASWICLIYICLSYMKNRELNDGIVFFPFITISVALILIWQ